MCKVVWYFITLLLFNDITFLCKQNILSTMYYIYSINVSFCFVLVELFFLGVPHIIRQMYL